MPVVIAAALMVSDGQRVEFERIARWHRAPEWLPGIRGAVRLTARPVADASVAGVVCWYSVIGWRTALQRLDGSHRRLRRELADVSGRRPRGLGSVPGWLAGSEPSSCPSPFCA